MRKIIALLLLGLVILTACVIPVKPVFAASAIENFWTTKAPMYQARSALGVVAVDGKIYAIGGTTSGSGFIKDVVGTNEQYNPATDEWVYKASMPTPRAYFAIVAYQSKIYCIGGVTGERLVDERSGFYTTIDSNTVEVYDTVTDNWTTKAPMPVGGGMYISAQEINGKIYLIGNPNVHVYDPINDSWADKGYLPMPRYSAVVNDKIIATGVHDVGYSPTSPYYGGTHPAQQILIYDPESNNITQGSDGSIAVDLGGVAATVGVNAPQRVYVLGASQNQVYDPKTDTWTTASPMPTTRADFGVAVVDDTLYAIGGYIPGYHATPTNINEQYIPIGYGTIQPTVAIISPENQSYNSSSISLMFTVDKEASWMGYSLDGTYNITVTGNTTLAGLSNGLHNITVYAEDLFGNVGASETVDFTVAFVPFPTGPVVAASGVTVAVVAVGLLYYFKKRNH